MPVAWWSYYGIFQELDVKLNNMQILYAVKNLRRWQKSFQKWVRGNSNGEHRNDDHLLRENYISVVYRKHNSKTR